MDNYYLNNAVYLVEEFLKHGRSAGRRRRRLRRPRRALLERRPHARERVLATAVSADGDAVGGGADAHDRARRSGSAQLAILTDTFLLPAFFDYGATFLWAVSGAMLAARRGFDVIGMLTLALVSSTGGGLLRDGIFLQDGPPQLVRSPYYLLLVALATLFVLLLGRRARQVHQFDWIVNRVDALGLGAYAVVGMNRASALGLSLLGIALVGMVNAVGGAVLRAVLLAREPRLFRPGTLEAVAALIGCAVFLILTRIAGLDQTNSAWITIAVVFAVRGISVRYQIRTKAMAAFDEDWRSPAPP